MEYRILSHSGRKDLEKIVTNALADGWQLQGGVSITTNSMNDIAFAQAVVKNFGK